VTAVVDAVELHLYCACGSSLQLRARGATVDKARGVEEAWGRLHNGPECAPTSARTAAQARARAGLASGSLASRVLEELAGGEEMSAGDLAHRLDRGKSNTQAVLNALRTAGLVAWRDGTTRTFGGRPPRLYRALS
jgi:hypothetical protein